MLPSFSNKGLTDRLNLLNDKLQLAFGASCCERLLPNYEIFQKETGSGHITQLRKALDSVWAYLNGQPFAKQEIESLINICESCAPSSEDSHSLYVTAAQDACFAVCSLLDYVLEHDVNKIVQAANYATDSVDLFIQEIEEMDPNDPFLEQKVLAHPLMQQELKKQDADIVTLGEHAILNAKFLENFRDLLLINSKGNLE